MFYTNMHPGFIHGTINEHFFPIRRLFSVTILTLTLQLSCHSVPACHISSILDHPWRNYEWHLIDFQDGSLSNAILLYFVFGDI